MGVLDSEEFGKVSTDDAWSVVFESLLGEGREVDILLSVSVGDSTLEQPVSKKSAAIEVMINLYNF